jgi:hypothetical protein
MAVVVMKIAVVIAIPLVVVFHAAVGPVPVARKIELSVMTRRDPGCALIRRSAPVSLMPLVVAANRIPVAIHKGITRTRTYRLNANDPRLGRRSDSDSDGKLRE